MARLLSVAHTTGQVRSRAKTVTRRKGWLFLKPGEHLTLVDHLPRTGKDYEVLATVEVVGVSREPLSAIDVRDVRAEGFGMTPSQFVDWYCRKFDVQPQTELTRIEWRYVDG